MTTTKIMTVFVDYRRQVQVNMG